MSLQSTKRKGRSSVGDQYADVPKRHAEPPLENDEVIPGFASLYQGDLGVEFALSAHQTLLESAGILSKNTHAKGHHAPFPLGPNYQCLVIDDFVAISVQKIACPHQY